MFIRFLSILFSLLRPSIRFPDCIHGMEQGVRNMNWHKFWKVSRTGCREVQALIPAKCLRQVLPSLSVVLLLTLTAQAQTQNQTQPQPRTGDWQAVKSLTPGTRISVKTQRSYRCSVEDVTDDELICGTRTPFREVTLTIRRSEIREIRIAPHPNQAKDSWIGAGIGAGAGAIAAGTTAAQAPGRNYPGFHAFVGGLAGAGSGALVGSIVPIFQVLFQRGKIIYKR